MVNALDALSSILSCNNVRLSIQGDFVKVEADRGEDLGIVCGKISCADFKEEKPTAGYRGRGYSIIQG